MTKRVSQGVRCSDCGDPMGEDEAQVFTCCTPCWNWHYRRPGAKKPRRAPTGVTPSMPVVPPPLGGEGQ